ncbi:hypothetical protein K402DRAFT_446663 [Aulographum hederae CBS 113979]|uniref:REJ domain-containing protein n=1 Tax=Aulographum hederae CBS 113979 TaxID=1176131 RepID=A0A6G1GZF3_9PEZI|nr:hypothetical protein K402DRAFT_446663 [Aulographum hederae CBS 113979]
MQRTHSDTPPNQSRTASGTPSRSPWPAHILPTPRSEDSWIEVSSRPSSSSLSSAADEIITTGLRVQHDSNARRRRRPRRALSEGLHIGLNPTSAGGSSQEEYEESESESDQVMTSSNEGGGIRASPLHQEWRPAIHAAFSSASSDNMSMGGEDEDESATAIGVPRSREQPFTPQPNVFTHPPSGRTQQQSASYFSSRSAPRQPAQRQQSYSSHTPYNAISPTHQADHDAALRASLSTLLSCAAAARGLPKSGKSTTPAQPVQPIANPSAMEPMSLGMVPESVALGGGAASEPSSSPSPTDPNTRNHPADKAKRKAAATATAAGTTNARSSSKDRRAVKKARRGSGGSSAMTTGYSMDDVSPTLLTWVVSAGVVVLVSALSFSAGYAAGREAGRVEGFGGVGGAEGRGCGGEVAREVGRSGLGLRRLRWGGGNASVIV